MFPNWSLKPLLMNRHRSSASWVSWRLWRSYPQSVDGMGWTVVRGVASAIGAPRSSLRAVRLIGLGSKGPGWDTPPALGGWAPPPGPGPAAPGAPRRCGHGPAQAQARRRPSPGPTTASKARVHSRTNWVRSWCTTRPNCVKIANRNRLGRAFRCPPRHRGPQLYLAGAPCDLQLTE